MADAAMTLDAARRTGTVPASALRMVVGPFELGDNGEGAKSAPIRMKARTAQPVQHWFWGRVVHDMAGMHMHKDRVPIDYVHNPSEVIGYLNHFHADTDGLEVSGALVPYKESDRASEIIHKARAGVPYEASINFGGDGIKVEEVRAGESVKVNGFEFAGPGIVIREWPLNPTVGFRNANEGTAATKGTYETGALSGGSRAAGRLVNARPLL